MDLESRELRLERGWGEEESDLAILLIEMKYSKESMKELGCRIPSLIGSITPLTLQTLYVMNMKGYIEQTESLKKINLKQMIQWYLNLVE